MKIINEFKAFAMRGNVVDMAIGIILGAAFYSNYFFQILIADFNLSAQGI